MADALTSIFSPSAISEEMDKLLYDNRTLVFNDEVTECILEDYVLFVLKWNAEDNELGIPVDKRQPIKIYFNSPGGGTIAGGMFMDVIMLSKTPVIGIAMSLVASMAYHIYLSCDKRYAFPNSIFLQHDGEIAVQNTSSKAKDTIKFFDTMDKRLKQHVLERTAMTEEFYDEKYEQEYWMYANEAQDHGIVHYIVGVDCELEDIL